MILGFAKQFVYLLLLGVGTFSCTYDDEAVDRRSKGKLAGGEDLSQPNVEQLNAEQNSQQTGNEGNENEENEEPPEVLVPFTTLDELTDGSFEQLAGGFDFTEGPVWTNDGYLLFSDIPGDTIFRWDTDGSISTFRANSGNSNGLTLDLQGNLISFEHGSRSVSITLNGTPQTLIDNYNGDALNSPNDGVMTSNGVLYFTDPAYGLAGRPQEVAQTGVYLLRPGATNTELLVANLATPNGISFSPDEKTVYIADSSGSAIYAHDVKADGTFENGRLFASTSPNNPDGMRVDRYGHLHVSTSGGVYFYRPDGVLLGTVSAIGRTTNVEIGGVNGMTLFVTGRGSSNTEGQLFRIPMKVKLR